MDEVERNNYYSHLMASKDTRVKIGEVKEIA